MSNPEKLEPARLEQEIAKLEGWALQNGRLARDFKFKTFVEAFGFMTGIALHAEKLNHHPDWSNSYNKVHVELSTHSAGGITTLDVQLAEKINALYRVHQGMMIR